MAADDEILKRLEERAKEYHTSPFLSTDGGGMNCWNVPVSELPRLVEAFRVLFMASPEIHMFSRHVVDITGKQSYPLINMPATLANSGRFPTFVVVDNGGIHLAVTSANNVWERIQLSVPHVERYEL